MVNKDAPHVSGLKLHLADDARHAVIKIATEADTIQLTITRDMLMLMLVKMRDLNFEWVDKRQGINAASGKAYDIAQMTALRAKSVNAAMIPETNEGAIIFETVYGPQAFAIPKNAMRLLAQRLFEETEQARKMPRKN